ncbi:MAG: lipoprotein-releasing ABC transporter permease subunit [Methylophilaceae bacterium]
MDFLRKILPFELFVGLRYTRAKRKNHFTSLISFISIIGFALGVAAIIVVLSVMNGFQTELRNSILSVASHIEITGNSNQLSNWQDVAAQAKSQPKVVASAPYVFAQGMLSFDQAVQGAIVRGILPSDEEKVADIGKHMKAGKLADLQAGEFNIILGADLAYLLGVSVGDKIVLMAPQGQFTPTGVVPRIKQFKVVGLFQVGNQEYDAGLALIHLNDASKLYRMGNNVTGLRLRLSDLFDASEVATQLSSQLTPKGQFYVNDWTQQHANFFKAIQLEKRVMFIIMVFIVLVASINIVSTLVMAVTDKRADIAIMRTLGAGPSSIMSIFIIQGALVGIMGTVIGALIGILIALNIGTIVPFIEGLFHVQFLAKDVYMISEVPSQLEWGDVTVVVVVSFILSLLATLYPSYKASQINPAEALRYE